MTFESFREDVRTQHAVAMCLIIIGDHAVRAMDRCPGDVALSPQVPWWMIKGMRNHIAHGYSELDIPVVWNTVVTDLPALIEQIEAVVDAHGL